MDGILMGVTVAEVGGVVWRVRRGMIGRAFCGHVWRERRREVVRDRGMRVFIVVVEFDGDCDLCRC